MKPIKVQLDNIARDIHLVGSIPLSSAREVFTICANALGDRVRRLPDGETGERSNWIAWQLAVLDHSSQLEAIQGPAGRGWYGPLLRVRPGCVEAVEFDRLGYADAARRSWSEFQQLQGEGVIGPAHRFQISLPTPLAVVAPFVEIDSQAVVEASYQSALVAELEEILDSIPYSRLAIQWDVAIEIAILEGLLPVHFVPAFEGIVARLLHLVSLVPASVELGIHLCYGDEGHKHFKEPKDTTLLVRLANALTGGSRALSWIHMPVPRDRTDTAFFQPLRQLTIPAECQLFLGLVHATDGLEGTRQRLETAKQFAPSGFGISTECGFGRRDPATVPTLLKLHLDV